MIKFSQLLESYLQLREDTLDPDLRQRESKRTQENRRDSMQELLNDMDKMLDKLNVVI